MNYSEIIIFFIVVLYFIIRRNRRLKKIKIERKENIIRKIGESELTDNFILKFKEQRKNRIELTKKNQLNAKRKWNLKFQPLENESINNLKDQNDLIEFYWNLEVPKNKSKIKKEMEILEETALREKNEYESKRLKIEEKIRLLEEKIQIREAKRLYDDQLFKLKKEKVEYELSVLVVGSKLFLSKITERKVLEVLRANCNSPIGVHAFFEDKNYLTIKVELFSHNGQEKYIAEASGKFDDSIKTAIEVGNIIIKKVGQTYINELDNLKDDFNYTP